MDRMFTVSDVMGATDRLGAAMSRVLVALARAVGVSVPELIALQSLDPEGGVGPSDLAHRLQMTTGAVTALVDRLEANGYVTRAPHPGDRRRVLLRRTAKADADLDAKTAPIVAAVLDLVQSLTDEERRVAGRFLDGFIAVIEQSAAEACER